MLKASFEAVWDRFTSKHKKKNIKQFKIWDMKLPRS